MTERRGTGGVVAGSVVAGGAAMSAVDRKGLIRLLKILVRGNCGVAPGDGLTITLMPAGEAKAVIVPQTVVAHAVSAGLVERTPDGMTATPAAAAFLRRALADIDGAFQEQHRDMVSETAEVEGQRQPVRRNRAESPLAPLLRLKDRDGGGFLPVTAMDAGERLLADFTRGHMQPRITSSWEPRLESSAGRRPGGADITDSAMAARDRFNRAVEAMGPELAGVAIDVCCFCKGLELVERERNWPARSAKLMLRAALLTLSRHYAPPVSGGRKSHFWGADGYRPVL